MGEMFRKVDAKSNEIDVESMVGPNRIAVFPQQNLLQHNSHQSSRLQTKTFRLHEVVPEYLCKALTFKHAAFLRNLIIGMIQSLQ